VSALPKIIFLGTPEFARVILEKLHAAGFPILAVVAQPDKPSGRGQKMHVPPVAEFAKEKLLSLYQPEKLRDEKFLQALAAHQADYLIVAAYGKILPESLLKTAKKDCLNVHASLLPRYRGAAPINHALLNDEKETGVAIMRVVKELDAGPVFFEKRMMISDDDDALSLTEKLAKIGAEALIEALKKIAKEKLHPVEQNHAASTYAPKLDKTLSLIHWQKTAREILNQVRALLPWPVAQTKILGKNLKIYDAKVAGQKSQGVLGEIIHMAKDGWTVVTGDGDLIVSQVQLEGKKRMSAFDVANGLRLNIGTVLGK
jgi:methionyl-tRNA formyltransferase